jgi:hypothetical protein
MTSTAHDDRTVLYWILAVLSLAWVGMRFLDGSSAPPATVTRALADVRAAPSPTTGRLEVTGLPTADRDPAGLLSVPVVRAGALRLSEEVEAVNGALTLRVQEASRRLERAEDEDLVALNVAGWLIPFYGRDASKLLGLEERAEERPWEAVRDLLRLVETRLELPPELSDADDPARRRELTRFFRELGDAGRDAEASVASAVDAFRADTRDTLQETQGPFRRRGHGRLLEVVLAALLGAAVRAAVRRGPWHLGWAPTLAVAPVLGVGIVLALERTPLLPVNPLTGTPLRFLPMAFAVGFLTEALLVVLSRLDRLFSDEASAPSGPAAERPVRSSPAEATPRLRNAPPSTVRPPPPALPVADDAPPRTPSGLPARESVRSLAREVMGPPRRSDLPRFEREVEEDPAIDPGTPPTRPGPIRNGAAGTGLPFHRKR